MMKFTDEDRKEMVRLYIDEGLSQREVAKRFNASIDYVKELGQSAKYSGIESVCARKETHYFSKESQKKIIEEQIRENLTNFEIAARYNIRARQIKRWKHFFKNTELTA